MKTIGKLLSVAWLVLWIGISIGSVGETYTGTYGWTLPLHMFVFIGVSWLCGFLCCD